MVQLVPQKQFSHYILMILWGIYSKLQVPIQQIHEFVHEFCTEQPQSLPQHATCWRVIQVSSSWSLEQRSESSSCRVSPSSDLEEAPTPRLVLQMPEFPPAFLWAPPPAVPPTRGFLGFLTTPSSGNSTKRFTFFWPTTTCEPSRRLRGASNMVSKRLEKIDDSSLIHPM